VGLTCVSIYSVSQKNPPPLRTCGKFSITVRNFSTKFYVPKNSQPFGEKMSENFRGGGGFFFYSHCLALPCGGTASARLIATLVLRPNDVGACTEPVRPGWWVTLCDCLWSWLGYNQAVCVCVLCEGTAVRCRGSEWLDRYFDKPLPFLGQTGSRLNETPAKAR